MTTSRPAGFTLVELIVIITILGVLAIVVTARFSDRSAFDVRGYHDELVAATRFAQRYAIASGCSVQVVIGVNDYSVNLLNSAPGCASTPVQGPAGGDLAGAAPGGVTASGGSFTFDAEGNVASSGAINVSDGVTTLSFSVSGNTGFVVAD